MAPLRVRYQTIEFGDIDIHIRSLRDNLQFLDDRGEARRLGISSATWPLFGVVWDAGQVLARIMWDYDIEGKKILEVGCGIGLGRFDLIIGSDLLYEVPHSRQLARFIHRRAKPGCEVIIVDPGRGNHNRFCREMATLGFAHRQTRPETGDFLDSPFKGRVLWFNREN